MAESRFIKTVTFGGYDKSAVDKRLEYLYTQVYDLKNELRESKLMLNKFRDGTPEEAAHESVLANERAKLTEFQVKNEGISERLKAAEEDNKAKEKELSELKASVEQLTKELSDANTKLNAASGGADAAMLGIVFAEAQKSANMILETAKQQAEQLEADSNKLAENMVTEANNKAAKIVYDAEKYAAEVAADAENKAENMDAASGNMKATMLNEVTKIGNEVAKLKGVLEEFQKSGLGLIGESEKLINETKTELKNGGVPVFKTPELHEAKLPDEPQYKQVDNTYGTGSGINDKKKNEELDKLKAMADSIEGGSKKKKAKGADVDLASLAKQAAALGNSDGKKKSAADGKKKGGVDLDELMKQAKSLKK